LILPGPSIHLQGFDDYGAAVALWGAGFTVFGVFRAVAEY
jgi:hypothetical protein